MKYDFTKYNHFMYKYIFILIFKQKINKVTNIMIMKVKEFNQRAAKQLIKFRAHIYNTDKTYFNNLRSSKSISKIFWYNRLFYQ